MSENAVSLRRLLDQVFADGIVETKERDALAACRAKLPAAEVVKVFSKFVADKWGEASADGRITGSERSLILNIISELNLVAKDLPPEVRMALGDEF